MTRFNVPAFLAAAFASLSAISFGLATSPFAILAA